MGALAGLGKAGEFVASKVGNQILAGTSKSPYLAEGYLNNADRARQEEISLRSAAASANIERMKQQGEDVREAGKSAATAKQSADNLILQNALNEPHLQIEQGQLDLENKRASQENILKGLALENEKGRTGIEKSKGWRRHLPKSTVRLKILFKKARIGGIMNQAVKKYYLT